MKLNHSTLFFAFIFILSSCKFGESKKVSDPFKDYLSTLKKKEKNFHQEELIFLGKAYQIGGDTISSVSSEVQNINNSANFYQQKRFLKSKASTPDELLILEVNSLSSYALEKMNSCMITSKKIRTDLFNLSKIQYMGAKSKKLTSQNLINIDIANLFILENLNSLHNTCMSFLFHYMSELSSSDYDKIKVIYPKRKLMLDSFMLQSAILKVIQLDLQRISKKLLAAREDGVLRKYQSRAIKALARGHKKSYALLKRATQSTLETSLPDETRDELSSVASKSRELFKHQSLLYDPVLNDKGIVNFLVVLSNLTWGSLQTSLGLGIILTHAVFVAPATWILNLIFPKGKRKRKAKLPRLKFSKNKMQIYADVCGYPFISHYKMSMGLFLLDFCENGKRDLAGHEGGHAKQSAILGPLYLPIVLLSYAIHGGHGGFMENWADDWEVHY